MMLSLLDTPKTETSRQQSMKRNEEAKLVDSDIVLDCETSSIPAQQA